MLGNLFGDSYSQGLFKAGESFEGPATPIQLRDTPELLDEMRGLQVDRLSTPRLEKDWECLIGGQAKKALILRKKAIGGRLAV